MPSVLFTGQYFGSEHLEYYIIFQHFVGDFSSDSCMYFCDSFRDFYRISPRISPVFFFFSKHFEILLLMFHRNSSTTSSDFFFLGILRDFFLNCFPEFFQGFLSGVSFGLLLWMLSRITLHMVSPGISSIIQLGFFKDSSQVLCTDYFKDFFRDFVFNDLWYWRFFSWISNKGSSNDSIRDSSLDFFQGALENFLH